MNHPIKGKKKFSALVYQLYSDGFASAIGPAAMPGPTLEAEVGDTIVVHFRNSDTRFGQALTVHPHGVRYNPEYDGAYLGRFTRAGGFIAPGEEFTYTWEATPDSVGVWPYHDHGPMEMMSTNLGLFGAIVIRPRDEPPPDVEHTIYFHMYQPSDIKARKAFSAINGRATSSVTRPPSRACSSPSSSRSGRW